MTTSKTIADRVTWVKRAEANDAQADRSLTDTVSAIIEQVRERGDQALRDYSQRFDNVVPEQFEVSEAEIQAALETMDPQTRRDSEFAIAQVRRFAEAQLATMTPLDVETLPGVHLGHRIIPIQTVGCYVPGGRYPILSAPVMTIVPATVAGCENIIACLPPGAHPAMIAVCHRPAPGVFLKSVVRRRLPPWRGARKAFRRLIKSLSRATPL
ncbi:histidinol dehydrogenase [Apirhabdus apintestini]|nr:histidinol dehydrogenase [Enterobacteriaceae bacterium CA-0114]